MPTYAWRAGAWQSGALKANSWGPTDTNSGDASVTAPGVTLAAAGGLEIAGVLASTLQAITLSGDGTVGFGINTGNLAVTISISLAAIGDTPVPPYEFPGGGGSSGLKFAGADAGGLGGQRNNKSLLVYGLKRRS